MGQAGMISTGHTDLGQLAPFQLSHPYLITRPESHDGSRKKLEVGGDSKSPTHRKNSGYKSSTRAVSVSHLYFENLEE